MPNKKVHFIFEILLLAIIFFLGNSYWKSYHKAPQTDTPNPTPQASPTSIANTAIPATPLFDEQYCVVPFVDWSQYTSSTVASTLKYEGDSNSYEKPPYYAKAIVFYEGRVLDNNGLPATSFFGNSLFTFKENGVTYNLPVSKRIENNLSALEKNSEVVIFVEKLFGGVSSPNENLVQDFSVNKISPEKPDNHWQVEIVQNGNIYSQDTIEIKNSPFTVQAYLPRTSEKIPWLAMNLQDSTKIFQHNLIGTNLKQSCTGPLRTTPKLPFCPGSGATFGNERSLTISTWEYIFFSFRDCSHHNLSNYEIGSNNVSVEKDVLYFKTPADDRNVFTEYSKQPLSAFAGRQFVLSFLLDVNENGIIEDGEIKIIYLNITR